MGRVGIRWAVCLVSALALCWAGRPQGSADVLLQKGDKADCDAQCKDHRAMVIERMKALRKEIDGDYQAMVHFGNKAGYVPPVRSIKAQVMDGTLLGGDKSSDARAPPAFDPSMSGKAHHSGGLSIDSILPPVKSVSSVAQQFMSHADAKAKHEAAAAKHKMAANAHKRVVAKAQAAGHRHHSDADSDSKPVVDIFQPSLGGSVNVHSSSSSSHHDGGGGKASAKWEKDFAFMQHRGSLKASSAEHHHGHHEEVPAVRTRKTTEPAVVKAAMQRALSFATSSMHKSKTEEAGDKLLGLHTGGGGHHAGKGSKGPLNSKFLNSWFGDA